ncbi:MAG: UDP-N-acetylglucosamine--LPS N-acetylglucosamine transferase [Actinomycetota bacterium]|nr:UDP-N-acetylglucosamine--LPS N-acetylglucosamine transferase [Actinomycetota bacterium]
MPDGIKPVMFTLSQALPVVREQGFYVEFLYSAGYAGSDRSNWNAVFERRLEQVLATYDPRVVVFDGTYPYRGLLQAIGRHPSRKFVWCRRAMWRKGIGGKNLECSKLFDVILEPGEFAAEADRGLTVARRQEAAVLSPILYCDPSELLTREETERRLGLASDRLNVLVQLGAGNINDISSAVGMCVDRLRREPQVQVVVAESTIAGTSVALPAGVLRLSAYPLSRFYRAFDLSVSAAGYNSYHELVGYGVPALFVPNTETALDDQLARARYAEKVGVARVWDKPTLEALDRALVDLLDDERRQRLAEQARKLAFDNGAARAADILAELAQSPPGG